MGPCRQARPFFVAPFRRQVVNCSQKRCWLKDLVLTVTGAFGNLINVWPFSPAAADTVTKRYDATTRCDFKTRG